MPYEPKKKTNQNPLYRKSTSNSYNKYIDLTLSDKELDIFEVHRDIIKCCGRQPKISMQNSNMLLVESNSPEESAKLLELSMLGNTSVTCSANFSLNSTKCMIYAPQLMNYSEEKLVKELSAQGVSKVERMKKKVDDAIVPQPNLILTLNTLRLPEFIHAAWHRYKTKLYIPRPKRCFYCQKFGHTVTSCRFKNQNIPATCVNCGENEHGRCDKMPRCVHCKENHSASSFQCDVYRFEQEVQAIRVSEKVTFKEAREREHSKKT